MTAASRRIVPRAAILFAGLGMAAMVRAELLEFRSAISSNPSPNLRGSASFTSVEALVGRGGPTAPVRAFAGGFFTFEFRFGPQNALFSQNGTDGVLAGLLRDVPDAPWTPDWLLHAASDGGNARINDVGVSFDGRVFVTGTFTGDVTFLPPPPAGSITFVTQQGQTEGFVAWADPFGAWIDAFQVRDMQPNSIALGIEGDIFLTGPPVLARRYDPQGGEIWSVPQPQDTISLRHVAVPADPDNRRLYVAGSLDAEPAAGAVDEDAFVALLSQDDGGAPRLAMVAGRRSSEHPGGLGVGPLGGVRFSFSSGDSRLVAVNGAQLEDLPSNPGRHAHLLFFTSDLELAGDNLLGDATSPNGDAIMETSDLAIDYAGNTHVAVTFNGPFVFEGVPHGGQGDAAVVAIDAAGMPFRFTDTNGPALARGNAVAAPDRDLQLLVGGLQGSPSELFTAINLPAFEEEHAYFAAIEPAPGQDAYILVSLNNEPLDVMQQQITQRGGEVYRAVELRDQNLRFVSAFLTPELVQSLSDTFQIVVDVPLEPNGTVMSSGWALAALNNAPAAAPYSYTFPETCQPTQLYLIDTAIDHSSGYFDGNPNLSFGISMLVRAIGDPLVSSQFDHGTAMLSMIAGPTYGAAQGTPITVHNYDIYPDGPTARLSALVEAIGLANSDKSLNRPLDPGVYCIASGATDPGVTTPMLEPAVDDAIGSGVRATVILSAGNTKGEAKDYTPSFLGSKTGVICAGAIDFANNQVAETRGGSAVDIWAPGENVLAADLGGNPTTTSGTSAATAFTTGAALAFLSGNPTVLPGDLENALVNTYAQYDTIGSITHVPTTGIPGFTDFDDWAAWFLLADPSLAGNDDGDIWTNGEEYVWGLNPLEPDYQGSVVTVSYEPSTATFTFSFPLACHLYQQSTPTSHLLRDGSSLVIERSSDLDTWTDVTATLTLVEVGHNDRQVILSFDHVLTSAPCFFRVLVQ